MSYRTAIMLSLAISLVMHLFFAIMFFFGRGAIMPPDLPEHAIPTFDIFRLLVSFSFSFIICLILYLIDFRLLRLEIRRGWRTAVIILCTIATAIILSYLTTSAEIAIFEIGIPYKRILHGALSRDIFISFVVIFSSYLLDISLRRQQMALEFQKLKAENVRTKYEALKSQVDPHFLFNSLNTLCAIIDTDSVKAKEYVQQLSLVFRYTLQSKETITLEDEVHFTKAYCSMMQIRYGAPLAFVFDIPETYMSYKVIPLSIQTLVENAIKHNVVNKKQPLTVTIAVTGDGGGVTVSNPLQPRKTPEEGEGIGLSNLAERYHLKWQREIEINNDGDVFSVTIPIIKP